MIAAYLPYIDCIPEQYVHRYGLSGDFSRCAGAAPLRRPLFGAGSTLPCRDSSAPHRPGCGDFPGRWKGFIDKWYLGVRDALHEPEMECDAVGIPRNGTPGTVFEHGRNQPLLRVVERVEQREGPVAQITVVQASDLPRRSAVITRKDAVEQERFELGILPKQPFGGVEAPLPGASGQKKQREKQGKEKSWFHKMRGSVTYRLTRYGNTRTHDKIKARANARALHLSFLCSRKFAVFVNMNNNVTLTL